MRKFILILSALMVSSLAYAADPVKAPRRAAVPDNNWTGFFFGLAGGYGFNGETSYGLGINHDVKGWFGCVEGGVRAQALNNPIVLGVVLDACYGDIDGNTSPIPGANVAGKIDWFGSARGLVGVSLNSPILLVYFIVHNTPRYLGRPLGRFHPQAATPLSIWSSIQY